MSAICTTCGLPQELCVCEAIAKESQRIKVYTEKRKFGKIHTIIEGIDDREIDVKSVSKQLKNHLACGGTVKAGRIELQGKHQEGVRDFLVKLGFARETIDLK